MKFNSLSNNVYLKNNLVVKESKKETRTFLDKKNEYNFLNEILNCDENIILKPIYFKIENEKLFSHFNYLKTWNTIDIKNLNKEKLLLISEAIVKFHNLKINKNNIKTFNHEHFLNLFLKNVHDNELIFDKEKLNVVIKKLDSLNANNLVVSHNDLIKDNFLIKENEIKIIDYDFVMLNNKYFDLASFISESLVNDKDIMVFVNVLLDINYINKQELIYVKEEIYYQDILWYYWANYMWEITSNSNYKEIMEIKKRYVFSRKLPF
ncbi:hypothetical protein [Spiroplasma endosymbiont of Crioceris asparagi]|uniref:phosphotransferase family protein n=1 Tax=Spiroplasma endosymbiont of Crioceris asparagi TaxID=3066286 RepID=UPI0030D41AD7